MFSSFRRKTNESKKKKKHRTEQNKTQQLALQILTTVQTKTASLPGHTKKKKKKRLKYVPSKMTKYKDFRLS